MSLIDRYIAEVGRHLPEKDRSDIEAEIRSTLEDMIEERGAPRRSQPMTKLLQIHLKSLETLNCSPPGTPHPSAI
ncbi:MAG: hypothetical protein ACXW4M_00545 [Anaerolineales bacterium]